MTYLVRSLKNPTLKGVYLAESLPLVLHVVYFFVAAVTPHHLKCVVSVAFVLKMKPRFGMKGARMLTRERRSGLTPWYWRSQRVR